MDAEQKAEPSKPFRQRLHSVIFEAETRAGRLFDLWTAMLIVLSIALVITESVASIRAEFGEILISAEYVITGIFTLELVLRLYAVNKPLKYLFSFYGMIDLLAVLPTYLDLFFPGFHAFLSVRTIRLLRIFRIFKLAAYQAAGDAIADALMASRKKISVFIFAVGIISILFGTFMYVIEGPSSGFCDIPTAIYWAVVTMTTVGYGDVTPESPLGKFVAVILMVMGFGIIAVPTGIVTAEMALSSAMKKRKFTETCPNCMTENHEADSVYCRICGSVLNP